MKVWCYGHLVTVGGSYPESDHVHPYSPATRRRERNLLKDIDETAYDPHRISTDVQDMREEIR